MEGNWRKSSFSGSNGGQCIEVASADRVMVRDTTDRGGVALVLSPEAWMQFVAGLK